MIAGETLAIANYNDYDEFFGRRRRKGKKKKRSKAERKARRRKFWQGVGGVIQSIGGFGQIGNTIDNIAGTKEPLEVPQQSTVASPDSSVEFQIGATTNEEKKKSNKGIYIAVGGVLLLVTVITVAMYMKGKANQALPVKS